MPSFLLDKTIPLEESIQNLDSIIVDDHFTYVTLFEGIRVQGEIGISAVGHNEDESFPISDTLDVDIMCPNEQICDMRGLHLRVEDSTYEIGERQVTFHIKCILEGSEAVKENFSMEEKHDDSFLEIKETPIEMTLEKARTFLSEDQAQELENLMHQDGAMMFSTLEDEDAPKEEKKEEKQEEGIEVNPMLEETEEVARNQDVKWFQSEPMLVTTSFYRVQKNDTYSSIAAKFDISEEQLFVKNRGIELKEGMLLQIKK